MEMKDLAMKWLIERHEERASAKLSVIHQEHSLIHVVVQRLRHPVEDPDISVERTDDVEITSRAEVGRECQICRVVAHRCSDGQWAKIGVRSPHVLYEPLRRPESDGGRRQ